MSKKLEDHVQGKVIDYQFENIPAGVFSTIFVATLFLIAFGFDLLPTPSVGLPVLASWYVATVLIAAYRMRLRGAYNDNTLQALAADTIQRRFRVAAGLAGLCWGIIGSIGVFSASDVYTVVLVAVGAMGVAAIPYLAADVVSYRVFLMGCIVPVLVSEMIVLSDRALLMVPLMIAYAGGLNFAAKKYSDLISNTLELRLSADRLTEKIAESNRRLQEELETSERSGSSTATGAKFGRGGQSCQDYVLISDESRITYTSERGTWVLRVAIHHAIA